MGIPVTRKTCLTRTYYMTGRSRGAGIFSATLSHLLLPTAGRHAVNPKTARAHVLLLQRICTYTVLLYYARDRLSTTPASPTPRATST